MSTVYVFTDYGGPERQQLIDRPPPCRARGTRHRNPSRRCEPGGLEDTGRTPGPSPEPAGVDLPRSSRSGHSGWRLLLRLAFWCCRIECWSENRINKHWRFPRVYPSGANLFGCAVHQHMGGG